MTSVSTGRYRWHRVSKTLTEDAHIDGLEAELRALESDLGKVVLDLRVAGTLSLAGRRTFEERIVGGVQAAICAMRLDDAGLVLDPTQADMDDIDRGGFVRVAAERLKAMATDPAADPGHARIASLALKRLYVEHLRQTDKP